MYPLMFAMNTWDQRCKFKISASGYHNNIEDIRLYHLPIIFTGDASIFLLSYSLLE